MLKWRDLCKEMRLAGYSAKEEKFDMQSITERLEQIGIVPVIALDDASDAVSLAGALWRGGLTSAEITFRTSAAEDAIREMCSAYPDMLVGAGTVLTAEQVDRAVEAGAQFIVSPGLNPKTVEYCQKKGVPIYPGTGCASDVELAVELGLDVVKFFPAEQAGGIGMIKALSAPYRGIRFLPTGGIDADNMNTYLNSESVIAVGGSWMVQKDLIKAKAFDRIEELAREAVMKMLGFELGHIGINCADATEAVAGAAQMSALFGFEQRNGDMSVFAGSGLEFMKQSGRGQSGHIAVKTCSVLRAKYVLERGGCAFSEQNAEYINGKLTAVYLEQEIAGFAVQLVQK